MTIGSIMEDMEQRVRENRAISPASWVESATRVVLLSGDLDNKLANYEAMMATIEAEYMKADMSSAKAKALCKGEIDYKDYLETRALVKRIDAWVKLAKKRAVIQEL